MSENGCVKGYKGFNSDWTCNPTLQNPYQYALGEIFTMKEKPIVGEQGFHFCPTMSDCLAYKGFSDSFHYAEVEALGDVDFGKHSSSYPQYATNKIKIVRELSKDEVLKLCNIGKENGGWNNVGCFNKGNYNTGDFNTGNYNTGHQNNGSRNVGSGNDGSSNVGYKNGGDFNVGSWNEGERNVGDFNLTNYNLGAFNSDDAIKPKIYLFNKLSNWTFEDWQNSDGRNVMMKMESCKEDRQQWWDCLPKWNKGMVMAIPNFDCDIFEAITHIDARKDFKEFLLNKLQSEED